jgi:hypothetical protein
MKQIFTFLFAMFVISSAFAQGNRGWNDRKTIAVSFGSDDHRISFHFANSGRRINDDAGYNRESNYNRYAVFQMNQQIAKITEQYNCREQDVMNNCNMSRWEKRNAISDLEAQKQQDIENIRCSYTASQPSCEDLQYHDR